MTALVQPVVVTFDGVVRLSRHQWRRAALWAEHLTPTQRARAAMLADLMSSPGQLEAYESEIGAHLALGRRPVSGATVRRLMTALVRAGLLWRAARSSPAGPPIFLARSPLRFGSVTKVSGVQRSLSLRCSEPESASEGGPDSAHVVSGVGGSDLRRRVKVRARARASTAPRTPKTDPISHRGRAEPVDSAGPVPDQRAAAATDVDSATVVDLTRPLTRQDPKSKPRRSSRRGSRKRGRRGR